MEKSIAIRRWGQDRLSGKIENHLVVESWWLGFQGVINDLAQHYKVGARCASSGCVSLQKIFVCA